MLARSVAIVVLLFGAVSAEAASGNVSLLYGVKALDEDRLESAGVDDVPQLGVAVSLDFDWPVMLAIDLLSSSDDDAVSFDSELGPVTLDTDVETLELNLGVRKYWGGQDRIYVGGGVAYVMLEAEQTESGSLGPGLDFSDTFLDDDDGGVGLWLNVGYVHRFGEHFSIGLDARFSDADAELKPAEGGDPGLTLDSGGLHYGVQLGYRW